MEVKDSKTINGSLQISTEVIARIAKLAALETDGVSAVSNGSAVADNLFSKAGIRRPVVVNVTDGVAAITVYLTVCYNGKIPTICEKVQTAVKTSVQNMTDITVSRVDVVVTGVAVPAAEAQPTEEAQEKE